MTRPEHLSQRFAVEYRTEGGAWQRESPPHAERDAADARANRVWQEPGVADVRVVELPRFWHPIRDGALPFMLPFDGSQAKPWPVAPEVPRMSFASSARPSPARASRGRRR